jgi:arsenite methyltransferase
MIDKKEIKEAVRRRYGEIAAQAKGEEATSCCPPSSCNPEESCSAAVLYSSEELSGLPGSVTQVALGCGNPTVIAELKPGEVVLDLGSGAGLDVFLAARQVGPTGKIIGLDMTQEMIDLAQKNAQKVGAQNVEFRLGEMEDMPIEEESIDVIISNCVINLSPDKDKVFAEAYRVLKPGGRMVISDLVTEGHLPPAVKESVEAWAGCVAGALDKREYLEKIEAVGFVELRTRVGGFAYSGGADADIYQWVKHIDVEAHKPVQRGNAR